ncbi:UNVERIFIED_CONTAM: hypothetical protein HDU68_003229, partial [Siphonaria sp. JEL0065]
MAPDLIPPIELTIDDNPIGHGAFGVVFTGVYNGIPVAIKKVRDGNPSTIKKEVEILSRLRHPNIIHVWGYSEGKDEHNITVPMMVMDRMEMTLLDRITCNTTDRPTMEQRGLWLLQIARAFVYLHGKCPPIVHKDLKPNNILIGFNNIAHLSDFGLSRPQQGARVYDYGNQLRHGQVLFTPPEAFSPVFHSHTSYDVYSFGMTAYFVISGEPPFYHGIATPDNVRYWVCEGKRPLRPKVMEEDEVGGIPDFWWSLIEDCWKQESMERISFVEVVQRIQTYKESETGAFRVGGLVRSVLDMESPPAYASTVTRQKDWQEGSTTGDGSDSIRCDFFISYDETRTEQAQKIIQDIQSLGLAAITPSLIEDDNRNKILECTVFLVLLNQEYEDSKQCRATFNFAKDHDVGMVGIMSDERNGGEESGGGISAYLKSTFWTTHIAPPNLLSEVHSLFKLKKELSFESWQSFGRLTGRQFDIAELKLAHQKLSGSIPKEIGRLRELKELSLRDNLLGGEIPKEIGNLVQLTVLDLNGNQLTGCIPKDVGNLIGLKELHLQKNKLTGEIPKDVGNLTELTSLLLHRNKLSGMLPKSIVNLTQLTRLNLAENRFDGEIPSEIGRLTQVTHLDLYGNQLTGPIPKEVGDLR